MPDYVYSGFMAQFWDLLSGDTSTAEDRAFFLELIERHGDPVLDVGCGTGRLLLDFLARGHDVDGIDVSPEMLDICEDKADTLGIAIDVYQQLMEHLDLPREYGTIIVASSAYQLIVDRAAAEEAMRRFFEHLKPGGVLAMPFVALWDGPAPPQEMPEGWTSEVEVVREDGAIIRRSTRAAYDLEESLEHSEELYEIVIDGIVADAETFVRSPGRRGYSQSEAIAAYERAGFSEVTVLRAWSFTPASAEDATFVVVGKKAAQPTEGRGRDLRP